ARWFGVGDRQRRTRPIPRRRRYVGVLYIIREPAVPAGWCLVIGAVLAPTDAVAAEGLLARVNCRPVSTRLLSAKACSTTVPPSSCSSEADGNGGARTDSWAAAVSCWDDCRSTAAHPRALT